MASGIGLAAASAIAFGVTIPAIHLAGTAVGPFTTASILYLGAMLGALALGPLVSEAGQPIDRASIPTLLLMALSGAAIAPSLFAWGLQQTGPASAGLLLNLEAVFTALLARAVFGEFLGWKAGIALVLMAVGGGLLSLESGGTVGSLSVGAVAVAGATVAWAIDNTASRRLSEFKPLQVVAAKGAMGAALTFALALATDEHWPELWKVAALGAAGATGYGASLRLYLLAQRRVGAARTASVFALAPFIGAALGWSFWPSHAGWPTAGAAVLFGSGIMLHLLERHSHRHRHQRLTHDHAHRHDDGHHLHLHDGAIAGEHAHPHEHLETEHAHPHGEDVHHRHSH